ncbi:MAG: DUF6273 domain-containing protein [Clostridiaceae bacterium]|nr:DUF6273 domain-containing protein [Clostridiaceae bacterium]
MGLFKPDIDKLSKNKNIKRLIKALEYEDKSVETTNQIRKDAEEALIKNAIYISVKDLSVAEEDAIRGMINFKSLPIHISAKLLHRGMDINFGKYEGFLIEWQVLSAEVDKVLLLSVKSLDCKPYNEIQSDVTWETCTLRKWLNGEFVSGSFSQEEQSQILLVINKNPDNLKYNIPGGRDTSDKVFCLSYDEVDKYMPSEKYRMCCPTEYAKRQGVYACANKACAWWLRSPGSIASMAEDINEYGTINHVGYDVDGDNNCMDGVRPALWLNLKS